MEERLRAGLKLIQIREPDLPHSERNLFTGQALALAHAHACKVMVKAPSFPVSPGADGIHFTAAELMQLGDRPEGMLAAASCHTREELERAMQLRLDFAVLGPVKRTASHETDPVLGWEHFSDLVRGASIPVYAIGGLSSGDLDDAWRAGAHGLAMISGAWQRR
jgi:8-oxo-dGTP diphosphatase